MPRRPCLAPGCPALVATGSYCKRHTPAYTRRNPKRGSGWKAARWRQQVLASTGGRCAVARCRTPYDRVQAHHLHALADGGHPEGPGVPLCHHHHHVKATNAERQAREARQARSFGGA